MYNLSCCWVFLIHIHLYFSNLLPFPCCGTNKDIVFYPRFKLHYSRLSLVTWTSAYALSPECVCVCVQVCTCAQQYDFRWMDRWWELGERVFGWLPKRHSVVQNVVSSLGSETSGAVLVCRAWTGWSLSFAHSVSNTHNQAWSRVTWADWARLSLSL